MKIPGCEVSYYDEDAWKYVFTGWYSSPECKPEELWDFSASTIGEEGLTLYAGWQKQNKYTYQLYYVDEKSGEPVKLGNYYRVSAGEKFDDRMNRSKRDGYTKLDFYTDASLTVKWDANFTHPGEGEYQEIPVYVDYIEGTWELVDSYTKLKSAISGGKNVYLLGDVDCGGEELSFMDGSTYNGIIEGNGYTVSNFTVTSNSPVIVKCAMFYALGEKAEIRNVSFTEVEYILLDYNAESTRFKLQAATLALNATGSKITNVSVSGIITTDYTGEIPRLNEAIFETANTAVLDNFTATIIVTPPATEAG